jgi:hemerythrin-like domain-containing protein
VAVTLGSVPDAGFDEPLRLLADCHRRIEMFLGVLEKLATGAETALTPDRRDALERAVTYFAEAAPHHTEDEEDSLFPRMRTSESPRLTDALAELDALEADHVSASALHEGVERLCRDWLRLGSLASRNADTLCKMLGELSHTYTRHIDIEERVVFAAAADVLDTKALTEIGREMADRRGVAWQGLNARG